MTRVPEEALPHSDRAERTVLGAILISNDTLATVESLVRAEDFYRKGFRSIFRALQRLSRQGTALDLVTLTEELERSGELDAAGGPPGVSRLVDGVPRSANVKHYAEVVQQMAWRRRLIAACNRLDRAARQGEERSTIEVTLAELQQLETSPLEIWMPSTLEGILDPSTSTVEFYAEGFLPQGETTIIGATWKSGKTLVGYRLILDVSLGQPAFGHYSVPEAVPAAVFQLEMPPSEDERRIRRLAIGAGYNLESILNLVRTGGLTVFNRPDLDLRSAEGVSKFHSVVRASGARVVLLDSLIAAFAGANLNDNSEVRALFTRAFTPLTSEGISFLLLHHHRKGQYGSGADKQDDRSALLGAQAFGAASGRVYKLERLKSEEFERLGGCEGFRVRLSLVGSWTPANSESSLLSIEDTPEGGTSVRRLSEAEQVEAGGVTTEQQIAVAFADLVGREIRISKRDAIARLKDELDKGPRTLAKGLSYAVRHGWVMTEKSRSGRTSAVDLVPGPDNQGEA